MNEFHSLDDMSSFNHAINDSIHKMLSPQFDFSSLDDSIMQEAVNGIASVFGNVHPEVQEIPYFNNMAMQSIHIPDVISHDSLLYNDNFMWHISNAYGNEAVIGIMAHEVGHALTNHFEENNGWQLDNWQKELCADYISGIYTRMAGIDPDPMINSFRDECWPEDVTHPGGLIREKVFEEGYNLASHDPFLTFEIHDLHGILQHNIVDQYIQPDIDPLDNMGGI
jgi:hypothetical protein